MTVLPFENDLVVTKISGKTLRNALERSAAVINTDSDGAFLQVSGVHVVYNTDMPEGSRVVSVKVRCARCAVPSYSSLNDTEYYNVIIPQFIFDGGDGHVMVEATYPESTRLQNSVANAVKQYLEHHDYVYPEEEGRIIFERLKSIKSSGSVIREKHYLTLVLLSSVILNIFKNLFLQ